MNFDIFLNKLLKNYKTGLFVSVFVLLFIVLFLGNQQIQTGSVVPLGIDFTGGTQAIVEVEGAIDTTLIKKNAEEILGETVIVKKLSGANTITIESKKEIKKDTLLEIAQLSNIEIITTTTHTIGASLGAAFFSQTIKAVLTAYVLMSIIVFLLFRSFVPSLAIILASFADVATAVFGMNLVGINLSMATVAGLLILIGYSIDTDILLSTRVLKRRGEGTVNERIKSSIKTGMTMSLTSIIAMVVLYLVSTSVVLDEIALVIIMGLTADIFYTWLQNVGILKLYTARKFK